MKKNIIMKDASFRRNTTQLHTCIQVLEPIPIVNFASTTLDLLFPICISMPTSDNNHGGARAGAGRKRRTSAQLRKEFATDLLPPGNNPYKRDKRDKARQKIMEAEVFEADEEKKRAQKRLEDAEKAATRKTEQARLQDARNKRLEEQRKADEANMNEKLDLLAQCLNQDDNVDYDNDDSQDTENPTPPVEEHEDTSLFETDFLSEEDEEVVNDDSHSTTSSGAIGSKKEREIQRRSRAKYKPPTGSLLDTHLRSFHEKVLRGLGRCEMRQGKHYYPPENDPVSSGSSQPDPAEWYRAACWKFVFLPFHQYEKKLKPLKEYCCIHCQQCGSLESKDFQFRPMFEFSHITWLFFRRVKCKDCNHSFGEIHPDFLSQLPTPIVERLPFITTGSGLGMHRSMLFLFTNLICKGVMFGTYVNAFNEIYRLQHSMEHISYLDSLSSYTGSAENYTEAPPVPKVFSAFSHAGEYNGVALSTGLLKALFFRIMDGMDEYLEKSFQARSDQGVSADHTFKFAKGINDFFLASYTGLSLMGFINLNRPTYTKSNSEIEPVINKYRAVRENAGVESLDRFESDGGSDRLVWEKVFKDNLSRGVVPFEPEAPPGLVRYELADGNITQITSISAANEWATAMITNISDSRSLTEIHIGLDCEWNRSSHDITRTLALSFPSEVCSASAVLFNLSEMGVRSWNDRFCLFPEKLANLLQMEKVVPVGVNIGVDIKRLADLGLNLSRFIDVSEIAKQVQGDSVTGFGMKHLCARYLSVDVDKFGQDADYSVSPLPPPLVQYACLDAYLSRILETVLSQILKSSVATAKKPSTVFQVGATAYYRHRRDKPPAAEVEIVFVGAASGEKRKWGTLTIGRGKVLVRLKRVMNTSVRAPFSFNPSEADRKNGIKSWDKKNCTLETLLKESKDGAAVIPVLAQRLVLDSSYVNSANILKAFLSPEQPLNSHSDSASVQEDNLFVGATIVAQEKPANNGDSLLKGDAMPAQEDEPPQEDEPASTAAKSDVVNDTPADTDDVDALTSQAEEPETPDTAAENNANVDTHNIDDNDSSGAVPRSRDKLDIFHIFDNLPLPRKCPVRTSISRLLIHATFEFDKDDFDEVTKYLAEHKGIVTEDALLIHFYFNREWWRRRVRMYTPGAENHARRIRRVSRFIKDEPALCQWFTKDLEDYLQKFVQMCKQGSFEQLEDVEMFRFDGTDRNGLSLWIRLRGSTRAENVHQKMRVAFGPWSLGARTGHYLLQLVSFRYNINTGKRRCNDHDFGHPWLHFIDRIDNRVQEIYGRAIFPRHVNLSEFEHVKDFVSVGIGPLCYDKRFVSEGEPDKRLVGDALFVATQMKVTCPPRDIQSPEERKIFNDFLEKHAGEPKSKQFEQLASIYLEATDCKSIFPKLPSMLRSYYQRWADTRLVIASQEAMKSTYSCLLNELARPATKKLSTIDTGGSKQADIAVGIAPMAAAASALSKTTEGSKQVAAELPVPPIVAPSQRKFVPMESTNGPQRRCVFYPFCDRYVSQCGGQRKTSCSRVNSGIIQRPDDKELKKRKMEIRTQERRDHRRQHAQRKDKK